MSFQKTVAVLERGIEQKLHRGAQVFVSLEGRSLADFALGEVRPGESLRTDHLLVWLSSTKPVTAIALGQWVERRELDWDDLVVRYLPEFGKNGKESITIRHLLTHTGGFRSADSLWNPESWEQNIARICDAPLEPRWIPGQKAGYHTSSSWFILGEILQRISKVTFSEYARKQIFEPLGMENCWIGMPESRYYEYGEKIGVMYQSENDLAPHPNLDTAFGCTICRPASNGRGPIRELARLYEVIRNEGEGILKPETIRDLTFRHRTGLYDNTFRQTIDWGLGFIHDSKQYEGGHLVYGYGPHASRDTFGHSGSQSSSAYLDRTRGLVVAWVCNGMPGELMHQKRALELNAAIYEDAGLG